MTLKEYFKLEPEYKLYHILDDIWDMVQFKNYKIEHMFYVYKLHDRKFIGSHKLYNNTFFIVYAAYDDVDIDIILKHRMVSINDGFK